MKDDTTTRRDFLKKTATALPIISMTTAASGEESEQAQPDLFQPEAFWRDRMEAPDDGKKYGWFVDTRRCFGCHACEVSCKAENDVPLGTLHSADVLQGRWRISESGERCSCRCPASIVRTLRVSRRAPAEPLQKEVGRHGRRRLQQLLWPRGCVDVCPYGAIYMDPVAKQAVKCHNCYHRTENGMEPACVPTCPAEGALLRRLNDPDPPVSNAMARR